MQMLKLLPMIFAAFIYVFGVSPAFGREHWATTDDPSHLDPRFVRAFSALPTEAELSTIPWSDYYWPNKFGGIAHRWQLVDPHADLGQPNPWKSDPESTLSLDRLKSMSDFELNGLSPAEKFDILNSDYKYPTWKKVTGETDAHDLDWKGICHGWSAASIFLKEPKSLELTNSEHIHLLLAASDIKAIADYYFSHLQVKVRVIGQKCEPIPGESIESIQSRPECRGLNAGAFHVALSNLLGIQKTGFVLNRTPDGEVWNQPIWQYHSRVLRSQAPSPGAARAAVREYVVHTVLTYTKEIMPSPNRLGAEGNRSASSTLAYDYTVEVDSQDQVVGGAWISKARPGFLWIPEAGDFREEQWALFRRVLQASGAL